jgi:hypothetical protein
MSPLDPMTDKANDCSTASPGPATRKTVSLDPVFLLVALVLVSTLIDLFFFTGYYASDDKT